MALQALFHNRRQEELRDFKLKDVFDKVNMDAADFRNGLEEWDCSQSVTMTLAALVTRTYSNLPYSSVKRKTDVISTPNNPHRRSLGEIGDYDLDSLSHRLIESRNAEAGILGRVEALRSEAIGEGRRFAVDRLPDDGSRKHCSCQRRQADDDSARNGGL
ncbi:unnamed protein product [Heligmosomoides polygyrus]|uniref:Myosin motor domain-containing protein n=1 Tax=Heligmosomoides polygyrus TaxID=6339 RepID=A0A183GTD5_HELPZ|nr:unnamed protein product [Heligmosomoides polygyrus]